MIDDDVIEGMAAAFPGENPWRMLADFNRLLRALPPSRWSSMAFVVDGSVRLEERQACAAWLRKNDLRELAGKVAHRVVPPGFLMLVVLAETEAGVLVARPDADQFEPPRPAVFGPSPLPPLPRSRRVTYLSKGGAG